MAEWTIERKINVATLLLLGAQIIGGTWWLATITADVNNNTAWRLQNSEVVTRLDERSSRMVLDIDKLTLKVDEVLRTARSALSEQRYPNNSGPR